MCVCVVRAAMQRGAGLGGGVTVSPVLYGEGMLGGGEATPSGVWQDLKWRLGPLGASAPHSAPTLRGFLGHRVAFRGGTHSPKEAVDADTSSASVLSGHSSRPCFRLSPHLSPACRCSRL